MPAGGGLQKLQSEVTFAPFDPVIGTDRTCGNRYAAFKVSLDAGKSIELQESFRIEVSPAGNYRGKALFKDDYSKEEIRDAKHYLAPNACIRDRNGEIRGKSLEIAGKKENVFEAAKAIYRFVIFHLDYKNPIPGLYGAYEAFEKREVDCGGFSSLFVAMCMALGIPARVVSGFLAGYKNNTMHAWAEFMLPGGVWVPVDGAMEQLSRRGKTSKSGRFGFVGSDRVVFSRGCDINLIIGGEAARTDILQNPFLYPAMKDNELEVSVRCITRKP